jgi:hypothetical protein
MNINEFEKQITEILTYHDEDGINMIEESLKIYIHLDGCLGATFRKMGIPCEGCSWEDALGIIVNFIRREVAVNPPNDSYDM